MKSIFKVAVVAIAVVMTATVAQAQTKGDMAAGAKLEFATGNGASNLGIGAKFQYNVTDPLRLEATFAYFLPKSDKLLGAKFNTSMWDFMVNAHWLFRVADKVNVYPVAGLGVLGARSRVTGNGTDLTATGSHFAFNIGGGADFFLSQSMFLNVEAKYLVADGGCFVPSVGVGFMF